MSSSYPLWRIKIMNDGGRKDEMKLESPACIFCRQEMRALFETRDYRRPDCSDVYMVRWCIPCNYGKIGGHLKPEDVAKFYAIDYYTHGTGDGTELPRSTLDKFRLHIAWRMDHGFHFSPSELPHIGSIVDIGCGNGENMSNLKSAGFSTIGVEPDIEARKVASKIGTVHNGTAEELPREILGSNDYVLMSHVLEHTISPSAAIENAAGILKKGGILIVEVPNNDALGFSAFRQFWPWTDVPRHIHFFTESSLRRLIEESGFSISRTYFVGYARQFRSEWIADQYKIWSLIGGDGTSQPRFGLLAWWLLARTLFSKNSRKYDSLRVHAIKQ
jgi:2-polyprenyl-3-methyl-5-hydroxy-6-metoxy-1,4-benzoquinol methylase